MSYDNALALVVSILVIGYLIIALLFPEKI
jgi:hypothetical protein